MLRSQCQSLNQHNLAPFY